MGKQNEYLCEIRAKTETSADLYFYGDIVSTWWGAWDDADQYPESVKSFLDDVKDIPNLNIYINCGGGACFAGMAIYNMLCRHKAYKTVYVDGLAASIASIIALCGDKIVIPSNAWLMIHKPWTYACGNSDELAKEINALQAIEEGMLNVYCAHAKPGVSRETIADMTKEETWLTGEKAAEYFNVVVTSASNAAACVESEHYSKYANMPKNIIRKPAAALTLPQPEIDTNADEHALSKAKAKLNLIMSMTRRDVK